MGMLKPLEQILNQLPPEAQKEARDFVDFLFQKYSSFKPQIKKKPAFKWAGALADLKDQYTSVELQHQISKWMTGEK